MNGFRDKVNKAIETQKFYVAKNNLTKLIENALEKSLRNDKHEVVNFPTNPENYISFCELTELTLYPQRKLWHTFVLQGEADLLENLHDPEKGELPFWKIRKCIKKNLSSDENSASVQAEVKTLDDVDIVFLRIVTAEDEKKLLSSKPTLIVYFPGEPYFYSDHPTPNERHCQVIFDKRIFESKMVTDQ